VKRLVCIAVALAFVLGASMASADVIVELREVGTTPANNVVGIAGYYTGDVYAGRYNLEVKVPPDDQAIDVDGYCIDPTLSTSSFIDYKLVGIPDGTGYEAAAYLLSQPYTGEQATEAQVAVWELTWDYEKNNPFSLTEGNLQVTGGLSEAQKAEVEAMYDAALAAIAGGWDQTGYVLALNPTDEVLGDWQQAQDYVIGTPVPYNTVVPLPGALVLLGAGLFRLAAYSRKRRTVV